jgi:hypothetical protein
VGSAGETLQVTASAAADDTQTASLTTRKLALNAPLAGRTVAKESAAGDSDSVSLPSKLAAMATASKGKVILAADAGGALYRSDNAGKKWKAVKAVWQGKVVELAAEVPGSGAAGVRAPRIAYLTSLKRSGMSAIT